MDPVHDFLAALQTERGASPHTLAAYRRDLTGFVGFLEREGRAVASARVGDLTEYLAVLRRRGLGARSTARHLSAVRGLYRFLLGSGGIRGCRARCRWRTPRHWSKPLISPVPRV